MQRYPPTVVVRHRKENLKKCSLRGLESREDFTFYRYPDTAPSSLAGYIVLTLDAPELSIADAEHPLCLIDATWRYAATMEQVLEQQGAFDGAILRSLPAHYRTAYPRRQEACTDPDRGLASVEALYLAYLTLGRCTDGLLDQYHWAAEFKQLNSLI